MSQENRVRVLIVDDDSLFREGIKRLMHTIKGITFDSIREAENGEDALGILREHPADLVLLDYQMPGGTGTDWLERIRRLDEHTAVIMITGRGDESIAVTAMQCGASDYLVKGSFTAERLTQSMISALDRRVMQQTLKRQAEALMDAERQRVMLESLGAACHHMGQPATILLVNLQLLKEGESNPEKLNLIEQSMQAATRLSDILHRLQTVSDYRTVPYLKLGDKAVNILDISEKAP